MPTIFDLELISTSINDALRANREGNATRRQEALKTAFSVLQGAQSAAQTRETIGRESRARGLFPGEQKLQAEKVTQAGQETTRGGVETRAEVRGEKEELAVAAEIRKILASGGTTPEEDKALLAIAQSREATQKAKTGKAVSVSAEREALAGQEVGIPELAAAGTAAEEKVRPSVAKLQPRLIRETINELIASAGRQRDVGKAALLKKQTDTDKAFNNLVAGGVNEEIARQIIAHGEQVKRGTAESVENLDTQIRILDAAQKLILTSATVQELVAATGADTKKVEFMRAALGGANRPLRSAADKQKAIDELQLMIDAFTRLRNAVPGAQPLLLQRNELTGTARQDALKDLR